MKKRMILFVILMIVMASLNAVYVEAGTGNIYTAYVPVRAFFDYSWSRTIYLQTDLVDEMEITMLSYNISNEPSNYVMENQSYYIRHTSASSISSTEYIDPATDDSYELVFSGDVTYNGWGWHNIILDNLFEYNGTDNLEIMVINNNGTWSGGYPVFTATNATPERAVYNYGDGDFPTSSGYLSANYPNIRFYFIAENEAGVATLIAPENNSINIDTPIGLTWSNGENTDWVKVYCSAEMTEVSSMDDNALLIDNYTQESYTIEDLEAMTTYYWTIASGNNISEFTSLSPIWSFTTGATDDSILVGNGTETNTHLPMEAYYGYSMTQSIYNQEWISFENQRIAEVSYYSNGNSSWTENNIQIYLGHTQLDEFSTPTSWVSYDDLVLVYDGPFVVPAEEGWVTLPLLFPFNYNNTDNLVVAFEANTQGYHSSNDDFYATATTGNKSIWQYSDSVNSNFINPVAGTPTAFIPNILLSMENIPTTPQLMVTPNEYSWEDTIIDFSANTVTFSLRNNGLGALMVNSVSIDQDVDFILTDNNTYPLNITDGVAQFTVTFHPLSVGDFEANITINDAEIGDTVIPLTGTGYDSTIYDFPHNEGFEDIAIGELPQDWEKVINSSNQYVNVGAMTGTTNVSEGLQSLRFYNSGDASADITAITPPIDNLNSRRIRFMAKSYTAGAGLIIGTAENNSGEINFTARDTVYCTTTFARYQHNFSTVNEDDQFIAFKFLGTGAVFQYVYMDELFIESIPTGPYLNITQDNLDFGDVYLNRLGVSYLTIQNWGISPLEIEFSQTGEEFSFTPATLSIAPEASQDITVTLDPLTEGEYSGSFEVLSNDSEHLTTTINTSAFILPPLPDNIAIVGNGTLTNQHMPIEPYYGYTYSQVIYYAGEIDFADQRIEKVSYHYNGNSAWGPDDFVIYMGHTNMIEFNNNTDWLPSSEIMEVYNGTITTTTYEGWIEFELDVPFIYDNSQNLVIAVEENTQGYHSGNDDFYCTASDNTRGIVYYGDVINPDPTDPPPANYMQNAFANITLEFGEIPDAPELTITPSNLTFEMVPVTAASEEKSISLRSTGLQAITIADAPTIIGADATDFAITTDENTYPIVLAIQEIANIGISFTPSSEGTKNAMLEVVDNATRETHFVHLNGYAYVGDNNDVPENATILTLPVYSQAYAITPVGDIDWYKIPSMNTGDSLFVLIEDSGTTSVNASMWLYGPVSDPSNITPNSYLENGTDFGYSLPGQGDYYLRVAKYNYYPNGVNPSHTRKRENGDLERVLRVDTGLYNLYVDAIHQDNFDSPLALEAVNQAGYIELTWLEPDNDRALSGYNIKRDGEVINDELIPLGTNLYHDDSVIVGTGYRYSVVGVYEDPDGLSQPSNSVTIIYYNPETPLWADDFEGHPDFTTDMPNWIQHDADGGNTYEISGVEFPNSGEAMSFIVFNPATTTPPSTYIHAQQGDKLLVSFSSIDIYNNDWIITPAITLGNNTLVSFYAKSYSASFGLERFRVFVSAGGSEIGDFQNSLHPGIDYLEAPAEWTLYHFGNYNITDPTVRFAIQCVSDDAFMFMIDNFRIDSTDDAVDNESVENIPQINILSQNYPNPFNPETSISFSMKEAGNILIDVYNIKGQKVKTLLNEFRGAGKHSVVWNGRDEDNQRVASGIYLYKMRNGRFSSTKKMILLK